MAFEPGTRLGPYEIIAPIGEGGMGEVYRARDTRLDRTVAIKVLSGSLAADAESRQRFEQEARAIAALNDPHICTIHDIGRHGDLDYIVLEHLAGETLASRLARTPIVPVDEALAIAVQIGDALDRAHHAGISHRDLKPGNVMLIKRPGTSGAPDVKLLDLDSRREPRHRVRQDSTPRWPPPWRPRWWRRVRQAPRCRAASRAPCSTCHPSSSMAAKAITASTSLRSAAYSTKCWPDARRSRERRP